MKTTFWKEKTILNTNANISTSSIDFQPIAWVDDFKQLTRPYIQESFSITYDTSKSFFGIKKLTIALPSGFYFYFFGKLSFHFPPQRIVYIFFKHFCNNEMMCIHMFFQLLLLIYIVLYMIRTFFAKVLGSQNKIGLL